MLAPWKKSYDKPRWHIKKQRHYFANKGPSSQGYGFSSSHVWMWELDHKESWAPKNLCFWTVVLEKTLESPLDCREIQPLHPKGNQSWVPEKRSTSALLTIPKPLTLWTTTNSGKFWKWWDYQTTWPASWETYMQVRKQQLELDMEQQTYSK